MTLSYRDYMGQTDANRDYIAYQAKYRDEPRESDKKILELIRLNAKADAKVLDIGCSTGNLVRYLRRKLPAQATVEGCDLMREALPDDTGFFVADALEYRTDAKYDVVVLNAVIYQLSDMEAKLAFWTASEALNPGGCLIVFDLFHHRNQTLRIIEESSIFPEGLPLTIRTYRTLERMAASTGIDEKIAWWPFQLYKHLPVPSDTDSLQTWTDPYGRSFRGCLNQPWCHAVFTKPA